MTKRITVIKIALLALLVSAIMIFTGCADLSTQLNIDGEKFSGERVMSVTFDMDELLTQLPGGVDVLDEQIDAVIPKHLTYKHEVNEKEVVYKFTLAFESKQDYIDKLKDILSKAPEVKFTYSSGVFTRGVTYNENFESRELLTWFDKLVTENGFKNYSADKFWNQTDVKINLDGENYTCKGGKVDIQSGGSSVVSSMTISTALLEADDIERTILITIPNTVQKSQITLIENYLNDTIPDSGQWTKRARSNNIIYTVKFTAGSVAKLQNYMEKLTSGKCECSLENVQDLSQPLAESRVLSEYIDFSYFGGESPVAVTYQISSEDSDPYQINLNDGNQEKTADTVMEGSNRICKGNFTSMQFKTILRNMAVVKSVEYNLTQKGGDKFLREIVITLEEGTNPGVLDNISEYYNVKGAGNTTIFVRNDELPTVVIHVNGNSRQVIAAEAVLFGGVGARALGYDSDWGVYNLHPKTTLIDSFDITSLITLTNVDKYAYTYSNEGNTITQISQNSNGQSDSIKIKDEYCFVRVGLDNGIQTMTVSGYYFNGWAVFFIVLTVLLILALIAMAALLYLYRTGKISLPVLKKDKPTQEPTESIFNYSPIAPPAPEPEPIAMPAPEPEPIPMPMPRDFTENFDDEIPEPPIFFSMHDEAPSESEAIPMPAPEPEPIAMPQSSEPNLEPVLSYPEKYHPTTEFASVEQTPQIEQPTAVPVFAVPEPVAPVEPIVMPAPEPEPIPMPSPEPIAMQREVPQNYTDDDMIEDLDALGLLGEYKRRVQKVKVKVRKVKSDFDE